MKRLTTDVARSEVEKAIQNETTIMLWGANDKMCVYVGRSNEFNKEYCDANNIAISYTPQEGGVIVANIGDIEIGYITKGYSNFIAEWNAKIIQYLTNCGLNATLIDNDIIIDGIYKVASGSSRMYGNMLYSAYHISIDVDLEKIQNICVKPMKKIPKGLGNYGITTKQMDDLFVEFCNEKGYNE